MSRIFLFISSFFFIIQSCFSQQNSNSGTGILFHGIVKDANNFLPVSNSQILINREFTSVSSTDGTFSFYVNRNDTVLFKHLGYKSAFLLVSDTLAGREFVAGIFLNTDTLSIGEVVIVPRFNNLKSEIMNSPSKIPSTMENARYNVVLACIMLLFLHIREEPLKANLEIRLLTTHIYDRNKGKLPTKEAPFHPNFFSL